MTTLLLPIFAIAAGGFIFGLLVRRSERPDRWGDDGNGPGVRRSAPGLRPFDWDSEWPSWPWVA